MRARLVSSDQFRSPPLKRDVTSRFGKGAGKGQPTRKGLEPFPKQARLKCWLGALRWPSRNLDTVCFLLQNY